MSSFLFESRFSFHNIHRTLWRDPKVKFTFDKMSEKQIFRNYAKGRLGDSTPLYCCCFSNFITEHNIFWPFFEWLWLAGDCQAAAFELIGGRDSWVRRRVRRIEIWKIMKCFHSCHYPASTYFDWQPKHKRQNYWAHSFSELTTEPFSVYSLILLW